MKSTSLYDDPSGFVCKLGDFGLSRVLEQNSTHVSTNTYGSFLCLIQNTHCFSDTRHSMSDDVGCSGGLMSWNPLHRAWWAQLGNCQVVSIGCLLQHL